MRGPVFWVTPGQKVILEFRIHFNYVPKLELLLKLELNPKLAANLQKIKLLPGKSFTALTRYASFEFLIPKSFAKDSLDSLGNFTIMEGSRQIYHEELFGVEVMPNTDYFEK